MSNEINIKKDFRIGDVTLVRDLTIARGLNKGKGFSITYCEMVKNGKRNNPEILALFEEVIENRNSILNKKS